jgi:hypothetical protein
MELCRWEPGWKRKEKREWKAPTEMGARAVTARSVEAVNDEYNTWSWIHQNGCRLVEHSS